MIKEKELIERLRRRDPEAYEILIDQYSRLLFSICAGILIDPGTREDVEDAVADCFLEFWENGNKFDPSKGSLKGYLCGMAHSRAIDRLRSLCKRREQPLDSVQDRMAESDNILSEIISEQRILEIWEYIQQFPGPDDRILTLRFFYEIKPADIALKLGLPVAAVYERIRSGKQKLRAFLKQQEEQQ